MKNFEIPDFDDMIKCANKIFDLSKEKAEIDITIKVKEKESIEKGLDLIKIDGKKPSMSYLESTVKVTGIDNNLIELRKRQQNLLNEIDYYKTILEIYKLKIEVWRTMSANERASVL